METPRLVAALAVLAGCAALSQPVPGLTDPQPAQSPTYLLRVHNALYGAVEASLDGGAHYLVLGRVIHPAASAGVLAGANPQSPAVIRSAPEGFAFNLVGGAALLVKPERSIRGRAPVNAIVTNIPPGQGPFGAEAPPTGAAVLADVGSGEIMPLADAPFSLSGAELVFRAPLPSPSAAVELKRIAAQYAASALGRARADGHRIVDGILTLVAKLPAGEPEPIATVTYSVDGRMVAAQNVSPFKFDWDTRRASNGEHVVEIDANDANNHVITSARALVVVNNGPSASGGAATREGTSQPGG